MNYYNRFPTDKNKIDKIKELEKECTRLASLTNTGEIIKRNKTITELTDKCTELESLYNGKQDNNSALLSENIRLKNELSDYMTLNETLRNSFDSTYVAPEQPEYSDTALDTMQSKIDKLNNVIANLMIERLDK